MFTVGRFGIGNAQKLMNAIDYLALDLTDRVSNMGPGLGPPQAASRPLVNSQPLVAKKSRRRTLFLFLSNVAEWFC